MDLLFPRHLSLIQSCLIAAFITSPSCSILGDAEGSECGFSGVHRDVVGATGILNLVVRGHFTPGRRLLDKVMYFRPA
ncbi:MAG: hypothetical protein ACOZCF_08780, partial [Bacillota bacterium]